MNATGQYNGILGYLQRKEVDFVEYPIPYDISNPPGILTTIIVESGWFKIWTFKSSNFKSLKFKSQIACFWLDLNSKSI